jgi:hypothetical protein
MRALRNRMTFESSTTKVKTTSIPPIIFCLSSYRAKLSKRYLKLLSSLGTAITTLVIESADRASPENDQSETLKSNPTLEDSYQVMAADEDREAEALEWAEATIGDVADEPR